MPAFAVALRGRASTASADGPGAVHVAVARRDRPSAGCARPRAVSFFRRTSRIESPMLFAGERVLHPHEPHRAEEPVDVLLEPEDVELLLGGVPVGAEPLEDRAAVLHRGRLHVDPRVGVGHELAVQVEVAVRSSREPSSLPPVRGRGPHRRMRGSGWASSSSSSPGRITAMSPHIVHFSAARAVPSPAARCTSWVRQPPVQEARGERVAGADAVGHDVEACRAASGGAAGRSGPPSPGRRASARRSPRAPAGAAPRRDRLGLARRARRRGGRPRSPRTGARRAAAGGSR